MFTELLIDVKLSWILLLWAKLDKVLVKPKFEHWIVFVFNIFLCCLHKTLVTEKIFFFSKKWELEVRVFFFKERFRLFRVFFGLLVLLPPLLVEVQLVAGHVGRSLPSLLNLRHLHKLLACRMKTSSKYWLFTVNILQETTLKRVSLLCPCGILFWRWREKGLRLKIVLQVSFWELFYCLLNLKKLNSTWYVSYF